MIDEESHAELSKRWAAIQHQRALAKESADVQRAIAGQHLHEATHQARSMHGLVTMHEAIHQARNMHEAICRCASIREQPRSPAVAREELRVEAQYNALPIEQQTAHMELALLQQAHAIDCSVGGRLARSLMGMASPARWLEVRDRYRQVGALPMDRRDKEQYDALPEQEKRSFHNCWEQWFELMTRIT